MDGVVSRLGEPRIGMAMLSAVVSLVMAVHWWPMVVPGLVVAGLSVARPDLVVHPGVWWTMAATWLGAIVAVQDRMEDHVHLFAAWLVALALSLAHAHDEELVRRAAWHARILIGATFTAAVAWKLHFGEFVTGTTLRVFMVVDERFAPLASVVGLPANRIDRDRDAISALLEGGLDTVVLDDSSSVTWRLTVLAVVTLAMEAMVAVSHLAPEDSRLASLRLPSVAVFGVTTYAVVPVLPFAALLAVLSIAAARWRREVMWIFPLLVLASAARLAFVL